MEDILQQLGLSKNGAKIYRYLVGSGQSSVAVIHRGTGIHRRNIYDALERLHEEGLIVRVISARENSFEAVHPEKLKELVQDKQQKLDLVLPSLITSFQKKSKRDEVILYRGVEGFRNIFHDILTLGEDVYIIGGKGTWFDPRIAKETEAFHREAAKKKIRLHRLLDHQILSDAPQLIKRFPQPIRVLPQDFANKLSLTVYGSRVITYSGKGIQNFGEDLTIYAMLSASMADGYRQLFQFLWKQSKKPEND